MVWPHRKMIDLKVLPGLCDTYPLKQQFAIVKPTKKKEIIHKNT